MLKKMSEFDIDTRLAALFRGWCALCPESGAHLSAGHGRAKSGRGHKYVLIVPNESLDTRGFFGDYTWDNSDRKFIRAWSEDEAIIAANKKLSKIVAA